MRAYRTTHTPRHDRIRHSPHRIRAAVQGLQIIFFFLNDPPPTELYPLPQHDPLPIKPPPPSPDPTTPRKKLPNRHMRDSSGDSGTTMLRFRPLNRNAGTRLHSAAEPTMCRKLRSE